ncbi:MAG: PKD domain-containing protein [Euryarchaeota archaeon]|nr:PKD domain-containing protein [Euryarchaeota archaeon]
MNEGVAEDLIILQNRSAASGAITLAYSINGMLSNGNDNIWVQSQQASLLVGSFSHTSQGIGILDSTADVLRIYAGSSWYMIPLTTTTAERAVSLKLYDQSYDDIVLTDPVSGTVIIYKSSISNSLLGSSPLTLTIPSLSSPNSLTSSDVNGDGRVDLIVGCQDGFVIFYNDGTAQGFHSNDYDLVPLATIPSIQAIMIGNFNNGTDEGAGVDLMDVAVINSTTNRIEIYFQQSDGTYSATGGKMLSLAVPSGTIIWTDSADVNSDGLADIVVATDDGNIVAYIQRSYLSSGFAYSDRVSYHCAQGIQTATVGDYDDDGFKEIAVVGSEMGSVSLIHLAGSSFHLDYAQTAGSGICTIAVEDVDGDNRDDVVVGSPGSGAVSIWYQRNIAPHADWYSETTIPTEGIPTVLNATGSWDSYSDNGSLSYTWKWRLSGGVTWIDITTASSSPTVSYAFPSWGLYEVSLMVSDGDGGIDWLNKTVRVKDGMPTAGFDYSGTLVEGMNITFTDSSTSPVDEITYFRWDFDDGTPQLILNSNETPVVHRFLSNGVYDVTLTVRDGDLNESVFYRTITIDDSDPQFTISKSLATINEGDTVTFSAVVESPDAVVFYHWSIENDTRLVDGASSSVAHQFLTNGRFYVNLTIDESDGDSSTRSILVVVLDSIPTVSFTMSDTQVDEGEPVTLQDTSTAYDGIASRYWQFGNGKTSTAQSPIISYEAHGNYTVTLWVMDSDGDNISTTRTISVSDTNPEITSPLVTSTGERNFTKGEEVSFTITVDPGAEMPVYSWTITSSSGTPYTTFTDGPSLSYTFTKAGSYHIVIRVSDSDRYFEESTDVRIIDQEPTAKMRIEHVNIDLLTVTLSANMTQDPDDDLASLLFSWNYGDGSDWTPWTSYGVDGGNYAFHTYAEPGIYSATLRVKDPVTTDYNEITITLDKWAPEVEADIVTGSYVGDPIQIDARVIDDIGVTVRLFYSFNGTVFTSVLMTPSDDLGNYSGQIPTPNDTGTIWYYISATDDNNNTYTTDTYTIKVEVEPSMLYIWLAMLFVACFLVLTLIFFSRTKPVVDEVFVIYHDGNLIAHQTRRLKPGMDDQILGSMFVALQGFVKDSFKDESSTMLKRMDFGEKKVMVEKGDFIYIAVVLNGKRTDSIPPRMQKVLEDIDKAYGVELIAWNGDLESLRGVRDLTQPLFERVGFLDLSGRKGRLKNA